MLQCVSSLKCLSSPSWHQMTDTLCHIPQTVGTRLRKYRQHFSVLVALPAFPADILSVSQMRDPTWLEIFIN